MTCHLYRVVIITFAMLGLFMSTSESAYKGYKITDIGAYYDWSTASAINELGQVAGISWDPSSGFYAFRWSEEVGFVDLGTFGGTINCSSDINEDGQIVGISTDRWGYRHPFRWTDEHGMVDLGNLGIPGATNGWAHGINDLGQVVGENRRAFLWTEERGMVDLGTLGGHTHWTYTSYAYSINNLGQVVGDSSTDDAFQHHAFLWTEERGMVDLGTLGGDFSRANDINDYDQVVGDSRNIFEFVHAFLWTEEEGMVDLGTLENLPPFPTGDRLSWADAINNLGQVVGYSQGLGEGSPFLWDSTNGMQDLNDLILCDSNWILVEASDINDVGQIVGYGMVDLDGDGAIDASHGYVLTPIIEVDIDIKPGTDLNKINLRSKGVVLVALLTTDEFDAYDIDPDSCLFADAVPERWTMEDVDYDGDLDMLLHFRIQELNLHENSIEARLCGETTDGDPIIGIGTVSVVPLTNYRYKKTY